tara:strand:+ start:2156 stop:2326 length:171 start_codon:yes stop_codon:yes gene_type:complete
MLIKIIQISLLIAVFSCSAMADSNNEEKNTRNNIISNTEDKRTKDIELPPNSNNIR